jgi:hypothetical protein
MALISMADWIERFESEGRLPGLDAKPVVSSADPSLLAPRPRHTVARHRTGATRRLTKRVRRTRVRASRLRDL